MSLPKLNVMPVSNFAITQWSAALQGPLSRLMAQQQALGHIGWPTIHGALASGAWQLTREDVGENAILSCLANRPLFWRDPAHSLKEPAKTLDDNLQEALLKMQTAGCNPLDCLPEKLGGACALDLAVLHNAPKLVAAWWPLSGFSPRTIDSMPLLHVAARYANNEVIKTLVMNGFDVNGVDQKGETALFEASDPQTVKLLVQLGANRTHTNHQSQDALNVWQARRQIGGIKLTQMRSALGRLPKPAPSEALAQFLALVPNAPGGRLNNERKRLNITGSERSGEGVGIVQAATRRQLADQSGLDSWMHELFDWEAALSAATVPELGRLMASCIGAGAQPVSLEKHLASRGLDKDEIERVVIVGIKDIAQSLSSQPRRDQSYIRFLSFLANCQQSLSQTAPALAATLRYMATAHALAAASEVSCILDKAEPRDRGWATPNLGEGLLRVASPVQWEDRTVNREKALEAHAHLRSILIRATGSGASLPAYEVEAYAKFHAKALKAPEEAPNKAFLGQLLASVQAHDLNKSTPQSSSSRPSVRL